MLYCYNFVEELVRIYGDSVATPNMHLHAHLRECIEDYGPVQSFWLFSFERYNGLLGRQPHNSKYIEIQIMRRFLRESELMHQELPAELRKTFEQLWALSGSALSEEGKVSSFSFACTHWKQMMTTDLGLHNGMSTYFMVPINSHRGVLTNDQQQYLKSSHLCQNLVSCSMHHTLHL